MIETYDKVEQVPCSPPAGTYVIVDILRFSTTACSIFAQGARAIHPVESVEEALQVREATPDVLLSGERHAERISGFDLGNSPASFDEMDLSGQEVVCLTSNGTRAINALSDQNVVIGSLTNAAALATYLAGRDTIHLVACGAGGSACSEDVAGVDFILQYLRGDPPDDQQKKETQIRIRNAPHANSLEEQGHGADLRYALDVNKHDVVPVLESDVLVPHYSNAPDNETGGHDRSGH